MSRRLMGILVCLTLLSFAVVQGMHMAIDSSWSLLASVSYGVMLAFQVFAFWQTRHSP